MLTDKPLYLLIDQFENVFWVLKRTFDYPQHMFENNFKYALLYGGLALTNCVDPNEKQQMWSLISLHGLLNLKQFLLKS